MGAIFFIIIHDKDSLIFTLQERLRFLDGAGGKFTTFEFLTVGKEEEDLLSLQEHSWRFIRHYPAFLLGEKLAL